MRALLEYVVPGNKQEKWENGTGKEGGRANVRTLVSRPLPNSVPQPKKPYEVNLETVHLGEEKEKPLMPWFPAPRSKVRHNLMFRLKRQEFKNHGEVWAGGRYKGQGQVQVLLV